MIRRRSSIAAVGVAAVVVLVSAGCSSVGSSTLPDVDIVRLDGSETVSLADLDGPAVINLWATWCGPCRREIPAFEAVHQARADEVRFVGVNVGQDPELAAEYLAEVGATYDQFSDPEGYVVTELDTTAMPVTIVIDADGTITRRELGPMDIDDLDDAIDEAIASSS